MSFDLHDHSWLALNHFIDDIKKNLLDSSCHAIMNDTIIPQQVSHVSTQLHGKLMNMYHSTNYLMNMYLDLL